MQKCEVCNYAGNPVDAKFCIECSSKLPIKEYTGATSRLHTNMGKDKYPLRLLLSGVINEDVHYGPYIETGTISSGSYSPFLQTNSPVGYVENDILYVTREELYQLQRQVAFFEAFTYIGSRDTHMFYYGMPVVVIENRG